MGRHKISEKNKAKSTPISLSPVTLHKLGILQRLYDKGRSSIIQILIDRDYDYYQKNHKLREDEDGN